jgi:hypothetical protein
MQRYTLPFILHIDDAKSVCTEESVENSLSVDTSDLDEIEAEYYFDQAVDRKVSFHEEN